MEPDSHKHVTKTGNAARGGQGRPTSGQEAGRRRGGGGEEAGLLGLRGPLGQQSQSRFRTPTCYLCGKRRRSEGAIAMALRAVVFELDGVLVLPSVSCALRRAEAESAEPR